MGSRTNNAADSRVDTQCGLGPAGADRYAPGDVIGGKYHLVRKRGEGGMGSVWVALNTALDMQVAVKLIRRGTRDGGAPQRLLREARAAASLHHPAIVRVFDFGLTAHDDPYIVMELLAGRTLADLLRETEALTPEEAVALLLPIAGALMAAHTRKLVHRDLKPENIFLAEPDTGGIQPVVLDFGIVKLVGAQVSPRLTCHGPIGTPAYMAPEQVLELDVDGRADIWTFSVVLYEAITGASLFGGKPADEVLTGVLQRAIPSLAEMHGVDEALSDIIARGLTRDPGRRWPSFEIFGQALALWLVDRGVSEDVTGASLQTRWLGAPPTHPRASRASTRRARAAR